MPGATVQVRLARAAVRGAKLDGVRANISELRPHDGDVTIESEGAAETGNAASCSDVSSKRARRELENVDGLRPCGAGVSLTGCADHHGAPGHRHGRPEHVVRDRIVGVELAGL